MSTFYLKTGDTRPALEVTLADPSGSPPNLTGAAVKLRIKIDNTNRVVTRTMTIMGAPTAGVVSYVWLGTDWTSSDALIAGNHSMEYEVTIGTGVTTYPNYGYDTLIITKELA